MDRVSSETDMIYEFQNEYPSDSKNTRHVILNRDDFRMKLYEALGYAGTSIKRC